MSVLVASFVLAMGTPLHGGGTLRWEAPTGACPDEADVAALVDEHLRSNPAGAVAVVVEASARAASDGQWQAELEIQLPDGQTSARTVTVASCEAAVQAVALAVALAVAPATESPDEPPPDEPPPSPIPDAPAPASPPPTPEATPRRPPTPPTDHATPPQPAPVRRLRGLVEVGGGVTGGVLPRPTADLFVESGLRGRRWQVVARGDYIVPRRVESPQVADAGGILSMFGGGVTGGPVLALGPERLGLELPLQGGVWAGAIRANGYGTDEDTRRTAPWAGLLASGGLRWSPVRRLWLGIRAELAVALLRHTFTLDPGFFVARSGVVAGRGLASIAFVFP